MIRIPPTFNGCASRKIDRQDICPTNVVIGLDSWCGQPNKTTRETEQDRIFAILPKVTKASGRYSV